MQRLPCTRCGDSIHPDTAQRHGGLCMPCVRGNQLTIEQRNEQYRLLREAQRAYDESPERRYWSSLVDRVHRQPGGFDALPRSEQLYWLIGVLSGEVHNGGFDQFFSNSSGNQYAQTVTALTEAGDAVSLDLLLQAKAVLFGERTVPTDRKTRFDLMPTWSEDHPDCESASRALNALDKCFYGHDAQVDALLGNLAKTHGLFRKA